MKPVYTGAEVRAAEQPLLDAGQGPELMRRAAYGLAEHVKAVLKDSAPAGPQGGLAVSQHGRTRGAGRVYGARVAAYVGPRNNGGDALFALSFLRRRGVECVALLMSEDCHADGLRALRAAGGRVLPPGDERVQLELERADIVIDALLGTGACVGGRPRPITLVPPPEHVHVVACDLPSGVDAATGRAEPGALQANSTVTFGALKRGLVLGQGRQLAGDVHVVDIGLEPYLPPADAWQSDAWEAHPGVPRPEWNAHKYSRGVVGLVAGSEQYPGAALLAAHGAVNSGVGMLVACLPEAATTVRQLLLAALPEAVVSTAAQDAVRDRVRAWVLGPGIGEDAEQRDAVEQVLHSGAPAVVDASGLAYVRPEAPAGPVLLTPHAGELAGLLTRAGVETSAAEIQGDPVRWAVEAAELYGAVVLLKGAETVVATPGETVRIVTGAPSTLATAGSGDVLAGIAGAALSRSRELAEARSNATNFAVAEQLMVAAVAAAQEHARAALALGDRGFGASALADAVGREPRS